MTLVSEKKKPNYLMRAMITVSLLIHLLILLHIAGIYKSQAMTYIELTLNRISKPAVRSIPRPRLRHETPETSSVNHREMTRSYIPAVPLSKSSEAGTEPLTADIGKTDIPFSGSDFAGSPVFTTTGDYFDMVRMKIESRKQYPADAETRGLEGRVNVRFVITRDGQVSSLEIVNSSSHDNLDKAALEAVKNAAPFPRPPDNLFKKQIRVEISILFELT